jgi:lipooligosaccharide transport system permease protein
VASSTVMRVVESQAVAYKRLWRGSVISTFLSPVLYLAAMGLGLGSLVSGFDYLAFLAPGLLAAQAMQLGFSETSYPVMAGVKWIKGYYAMLATPIGPGDIAVGTIVWVAVRLLMASAIFAGVMVVFGVGSGFGLLLAIPAAVLTGLAYAAPNAAYTATMQDEATIASVLRFVIIPMFLFSGVFFPIEQLPNWLEWIAYLVPLWHGVALCRSLTDGTATLVGSALHVGYLAVVTVAGTFLAIRTFTKRLVV